MFKFGFEDAQPDDQHGRSCDGPPEAPTPLPPPTKVTPSSIPPLQNTHHDLVPIANSAFLLRKSTAIAPAHLSPSHADIIPRTYEGGFKLWECSLDLAEYLHTSPPLKDKAVLELGAGHAFPAIVAARKEAAVVHVQDYNVEVLHDVTIPNVAANVEGYQSVFEFFCGDWARLAPILGRKYDLILSAETIYATEQINELATCLANVIAPGGVALIAGKSYYFGVGGGMTEFIERVKQTFAAYNKQVDVKRVKEIRDGQSNVREIVQLINHHM